MLQKPGEITSPARLGNIVIILFDLLDKRPLDTPFMDILGRNFTLGLKKKPFVKS